MLRFALDLRRSSREDPRAGILRLTCLLDGAEATVTDDWFEDGLIALEAALPDGHRIMACITCEHAAHSPMGHGLSGMRCCRNADVAGVPSTAGVTEEVLETYLCTSFRRRLAGGVTAPSRASATSREVARRYFLRYPPASISGENSRSSGAPEASTGISRS